MKNKSSYFIPNPSHYPICIAIGLLIIFLSFSFLINGYSLTIISVFIGFLFLFFFLYMWFKKINYESKIGVYNKNVDKSFRISIIWFIFSEIMLFFTLLSAFIYIRKITLSQLGSLDNKLIWKNFLSIWPNNGPANLIYQFKPIDPWPIPTINTILLLTSSVLLTISHNLFKKKNNKISISFLISTIILGFIFLYMQGIEYFYAIYKHNLYLYSGIYGSMFFTLTGFHAFHVLLGLFTLIILLIRLTKYNLYYNNKFIFDITSWYWHFIDIIWLFLYIILYLF